MSYRSIKRVLGETSLERKIRVLFGVILLALIAGAFLWVNRITEELIRENTRAKAHSLIETHLLRIHFEKVHITREIDPNDPVQDAAEQMYRQAIAVLTRFRDYRVDVLAMNDHFLRGQIRPLLIAEGQEREVLTGLDTLVRARQFRWDDARQRGERIDEPLGPQQYSAAEKRAFPDRFLADNWYAYYEPIEFKPICLNCHVAVRNPDATGLATALADMDLLGDPDREPEVAEDETANELREIPTFFLKVYLPYRAAKEAINRSRAILLAVAIITAFLSMLALYLIVRYVIVKPLKHLRDVADQVSRGEMDVRSDLATGDEFEELSRSFNRMLRHLLDTQAQLQELNRSLDRKVDEQAQLNLQLHEMNQIKSDFLANMSHELRTPLHAIIGFSELLEAASNLMEKDRRYAANIRKSGRLLLDLITDILNLAKLEAGEMDIQAHTFNIHQLIQEQCELMRHLADKKNIQLQMEAPVDLPDMWQDSGKIRQIVTNLLSNAIKFTPEGGRIRVSLERDNQPQLILKVADTGVGIPESDQAIIFEKFRQGPSALGDNQLTREIAGTGLGLSIVRELCHLLGGTIDLSSEVGKGSTFTVKLPWNAERSNALRSTLQSEIDDLIKPQRVDFTRTLQTPSLPMDAGSPEPDQANPVAET
ncbi:MAG TPA: ATP-binding protein [Pirellulaceae bacterium]|nr:ATP-binding protein [Pirellulaceae bacterium]